MPQTQKKLHSVTINGNEIRVYEVDGIPAFVSMDIQKLFLIQNIRQSIIDYTDEDKTYIYDDRKRISALSPSGFLKFAMSCIYKEPVVAVVQMLQRYIDAGTCKFKTTHKRNRDEESPIVAAGIIRNKIPKSSESPGESNGLQQEGATEQAMAVATNKEEEDASDTEVEAPSVAEFLADETPVQPKPPKNRKPFCVISLIFSLSYHKDTKANKKAIW